ncbi:hypothetical protein [Vulgatibacter incomptus]|uniref:hypothetical protein n=1 Tax=Vulgatibacter incomptus TaxID=1391653 RepID=UPI0006833FCB|nr:hypothetical protein [Vulgatibacter incomptus]
MSQRDARQLRRMLTCISGTRQGGVALVEVADSLIFLRDALENVEESWSDEFTSHVATLESAGVATSAQIERMGPQHQAIVSGALDALEAMVKARYSTSIHECPTKDDDA